MANLEKATFAGGCFWCTEAVFNRIQGVKTVTSGYTGGDMDKPSYEDVSSGSTGHVEAVQIEFDPAKVSYEELLEVFWSTHDPSQAGGQGADVGPQYQAVIFYHDNKQKKLAEESKEKMEKSGPVATLILPYKNFYPAEEYHQKYFEKNPHEPYCQIVIRPKIEKVEKLYGEKLKDSKN